MHKPVKQPTKALGYRNACELMRRSDVRLVKMRSEGAANGFAHYIVPGGYVDADIAEKIKQHPFVRASEDGLFPGLDQTWRMIE